MLLFSRNYYVNGTVVKAFTARYIHGVVSTYLNNTNLFIYKPSPSGVGGKVIILDPRSADGLNTYIEQKCETNTVEEICTVATDLLNECIPILWEEGYSVNSSIPQDLVAGIRSNFKKQIRAFEKQADAVGGVNALPSMDTHILEWNEVCYPCRDGKTNKTLLQLLYALASASAQNKYITKKEDVCFINALIGFCEDYVNVSWLPLRVLLLSDIIDYIHLLAVKYKVPFDNSMVRGYDDISMCGMFKNELAEVNAIFDEHGKQLFKAKLDNNGHHGISTDAIVHPGAHSWLTKTIQKLTKFTKRLYIK